MSWDGLIFRAPADASLQNMPADFQMQPLGTTSEIGDVLRRLFPDQSHHHGQCCVEGDDFWLELNFSDRKADIRSSIGVRSNAGLGALSVLRQVCDAFGARLVDCQTGEFADLESATRSSMTTFAEWRDRALQKMRDDIDPNSAEGQGFEP